MPGVFSVGVVQFRVHGMNSHTVAGGSPAQKGCACLFKKAMNGSDSPNSMMLAVGV